jgi:hypothetical protein
MRRGEVYRLKRRELAWALAGFVLIQLGLAVAIDHFWTAARDPEYSYRENLLRRRLAESPGRPLVLFLGSSRTLMGVMAGRISEQPGAPLAFNFGVPGSGPMMEMTNLRRLLAAGVRPQLLVLEVMALHLGQGRRSPLEEKQLDAARLGAGELSRLLRYYCGLDWVLRRWIPARAFPLYRHQAEMRDCLGLDVPAPGHEPPSVDRGLDGYGWHAEFAETMPERRAKLTEFALEQYRDPAADFRLAPQPGRALCDLLRLCRREGLPVAVVLMPEGSRFRELSAGTYPSVDRFLDRACREYGAALIDARTWVDDAGFWDGHHMLPEGARQFTDRFRRDVLPGLLENLPSQKPAGSLAAAHPAHEH